MDESEQNLPGKWRVEMLGGLLIRSPEGEVTELSRRKSGSLFAYLALFPQRAHSRELLAALNWPNIRMLAPPPLCW